MKKKSFFGYTLIELLVVISIIGILMSFALVSLKGTARTARDGRRKTDLELIRSGLAAYYDVHRSYPSNNNLNILVTENFINNLPLDPLTSQPYTYTPLLNSSYDLCAALENATGGVGSGSHCWGTVGNCDDQCVYSSTTSPTVYTNCASSVCGSSGCWGIGGSCDAGCTASSVTSNTVYPDCDSASCGGGNCWTTDWSTCDSGCTVASVNSASVYSSCAPESCGVYKWKSGDLVCDSCYYQAAMTGSDCTGGTLGYSTPYNCPCPHCSTDGSGNCYTFDISSYRQVSPKSLYESCGRCLYNLSYSVGVYDLLTCTWTCESGCDQKKYVVSGQSLWKYAVSGSCKSSGLGSCYKPLNGNTYFSGGADCGASGCPSGIYYDDTRQCGWLSTLYSYSVSGSPVQAYLGGGSCNAGGTGSCYKLTGGSTKYTGGTSCGGSGCGSGTYYSGSTACSWIPSSTYTYTASGSTTKYSGSGTCSSSGTPPCYKLTGGSSYYTGNGACGSGGCGSGTYYTGSSSCSFYAGSACNYHVKNP